MISEFEDIKKQHEQSYKKALVEIVKNNTDVLVDEDIKILLKTPPLDSMDLIKAKMLDLAKKNKLILDTNELSKILNCYRKEILKCSAEIKKIRLGCLIKKIEQYDLKKSNDTIKINKKDFIDINKQIKKVVKNQLDIAYQTNIEKKVNKVFTGNIDKIIIDNYLINLSKYLNGKYQKQLMESFDIKVLVKDTTLINSVKEQAERYLFTLHNSRLLNDIK